MNDIIKAGKIILNALAFANAENYSEFRSLLRQAEHNGSLSCNPVHYRSSGRFENENPLPAATGHHAQQVM